MAMLRNLEAILKNVVLALSVKMTIMETLFDDLG